MLKENRVQDCRFCSVKMETRSRARCFHSDERKKNLAWEIVGKKHPQDGYARAGIDCHGAECGDFNMRPNRSLTEAAVKFGLVGLPDGAKGRSPLLPKEDPQVHDLQPSKASRSLISFD